MVFKMKLNSSLIAFQLLLCPFLLMPLDVIAQQVNKKQDLNYSQAKKELNGDYYVLYRIVDKLARANDTASTSWRVRLSEKYALNGFADEANLIIVPKAAVEQLSGNPDALACMVGREISHHIRKHQAVGPTEKMALKRQIAEEVASQLKANEGSKRGWGMGLGLIGGLTGVSTSGIQGAINSSTDNASAKMIAEKEAELDKRIADTSSRIEKEADEDAFIYLSRAGRDPKGCIVYLDFISRDPSAEADPSNPQIPGRIQAYRDFINRESSTKFKQEGSSNLSRLGQSLNYKVTDNGASLRIEAYGGSTNSKIENF